ncbi:MAG: Hsp70 family protein [Kiritimatiellaeota bacterium]|nr:Hsp70 family protein [Kiritimatiellota bacterium]
MEECFDVSGTASPDYAARFVVGIDLGTTNIAVSYVDTARDRVVRPFPVPQLTGPGETSEGDLLPAFCYFPAEHELPEGALTLPWDREKSYAVGAFARDRGAATPGRLIASAKSWLAHGGVDRTRGILPWGGDLGERAVSPVAVTAFYLEHLRCAWDARFGQELDAEGTPCRLAEQQVIITVPASFDEAARRLTLEAAAEAGIRTPVLLEEPLAAFYDWLRGHESTWRASLGADATVLIVDVGGGTTDFSLVSVAGDGALRRTAVGDHLLLGGDNMDMALAKAVEQGWGGEPLPARQWSQLCQACRQAKETLMAEDAPDRHLLAVAAPGSAVVGSTRTWTFLRSDVRGALLEGFFPPVGPDASPPARGAGIRQMGLPYASDPAITRHLLAFLRAAGLPSLTHVLFNGGALLPALFRERLRSVLGQWLALDGPLPELAASSLRTAVAGGAAYYGLVRRGAGVRVRGGAARSYYIAARRGRDVELVCVLPRDAEEGQVVHLAARRFRVTTNRPVRFALHASSTRLGDQPGQVIRDRDELTPLPPVQTVLVHGRRDRCQVMDVQMNAVLTEIGTLDLWCTTLDGRHRFPLSFDLRAAGTSGSGADHGATVPEAILDKAGRLLGAAFDDRHRLRGVMRDLEEVVGAPRSEWGAALLRRLADWMLDRAELRTQSPEHEARWLNLAGYFVRPGYGFPGDDWRIRRLWRIWPAGPLHPRSARVTTEWWVLWRRASGGLRAGQQQQIAGRLCRDLLPKSSGGGLGPPKSLAYAGREMWRCLGALERIPSRQKLRVLRRLTANAGILKECHWWALARLGARRPMYGPLDAVVRAPDLISLLPKLFEQVRRRPARQALFALAAVCRVCRVRDLDLSAEARERAVQILTAENAPGEWLKQLAEVCDDTRQYRAEFAGDSLPLGLDLVAGPAGEDGARAAGGGGVRAP